jgi:hypothetical protein
MMNYWSTWRVNVILALKVVQKIGYSHLSHKKCS